MSSVILGGFAFQGFEVPARIPFGGRHMVVPHRLIGGQRVIDANGPDEEEISWSGRFRGSDALSRAQAVDAMRIAGAKVDLTWLGLHRSVVVTHFRADPEKAWEVPYTISCMVADNPGGGGLGGIASTLDNLVSGDLSSISSIMAR